jgi:hypothetical protein
VDSELAKLMTTTGTDRDRLIAAIGLMIEVSDPSSRKIHEEFVYRSGKDSLP